jgi:hypothetical protein
MPKKKVTCEPHKYMDEAEKLLRRIFEDRPDIGVWRVKVQKKPEDRSFDVDTILVGLRDESKPNEPTDLILLSTALKWSGSAEMNIYYAKGLSLSTVPFGGGWYPLKELGLLAKEAHGF